MIRFGTSGPIPQDSTIEITFPNAYLTSANPTCTPVDWPTTSPTLSCTYSAFKLTITGAFPSDSNFDTFKITATDITNPFPASTYSPFAVALIYPDTTK